MAKVNTIIYDQNYVAHNNPNMKFRLTVRSYDGTDRKTSDDFSFINGAIDNHDVMSDRLGISDLKQSEHIILRDFGSRSFDRYNYHMVESLANSCDIISVPDYEETITDNYGVKRLISQTYYKEADNPNVTVKTYVDKDLLKEETFNIQYDLTDYNDEDPRPTVISQPPDDFERLQANIRNDIEAGLIAQKTIPNSIEDVYVTNNVKFHYKLLWNSTLIPEDDIFINRLILTVKYGLTDKTTTLCSTRTLYFRNSDYNTKATTIENVVVNETNKLKNLLDHLAEHSYRYNNNVRGMSISFWNNNVQTINF